MTLLHLSAPRGLFSTPAILPFIPGLPRVLPSLVHLAGTSFKSLSFSLEDLLRFTSPVFPIPTFIPFLYLSDHSDGPLLLHAHHHGLILSHPVAPSPPTGDPSPILFPSRITTPPLSHSLHISANQVLSTKDTHDLERFSSHFLEVTKAIHEVCRPAPSPPMDQPRSR